ncbi:T6SS phospholipase effector Tle1-like catalytic domain-containing protein [Marinobacter sp. SBS5]|uniref:T6SS phospholipase effector Tle1-like catalytic domain-containing protein n=1 Tax=Marinobacter sp. SBS5 TaxID=3401754 RepID=UPI003AB03A81
MKIVSTWDLRAADLPRLESPFFAAVKAKSLILDNSHNANKVDVERLLGRVNTYPAGGRAARHYRTGLVEEVVRRIDEGELWLVHEVVDGEPSAPVVYWQSSGDSPEHWVLGEGVANSEIRSSVEALNRHGITPQQLAYQGIGSVGYLGASQFGSEYREKQKEEARQQRPSSKNSTTSFPAQSLAPLALSTAQDDEPETSKKPQEIHLEIGIFTDGTLNNAENSRELEERAAKECVHSFERGEISEEECSYRLALMMGGSYGNAPTNVAKLADLYDRSSVADSNKTIHRRSVYVGGVGTKTGQGDSLVGAATGIGDTGIISQVEEALAGVVRQISMLALADPIEELCFDLFGFSRGAAAARHAVREISLGRDGVLGQILASHQMEWPNKVVIRFVGLFDTVAAVINPEALDFWAGNHRNDPVQVYLDPTKVGHAVQLVAEDEHRENFALNSLRAANGSLSDNFREISLLGAHSDIGGGYPDTQREEVLISPPHLVPSNRVRWPEQTMQWDSLVALKQKKLAQGWIGSFSLPLILSMGRHSISGVDKVESEPSLSVVKNKLEHPAPSGRVELSLKMVRQIRGEYSRVGLKVMHELAAKRGVPFKAIDPEEAEHRLPEELEPVANALLEQVAGGIDKPKLSTEHRNLIRQRYTHYSAHYNPLELALGDTLTSFRIGRNFSPNAPTDSGERVAYPNV